MNEYYVVRIPFNEAGEVAEFWREETTFRLPAHFSLDKYGFPDRHYAWSVQVMRWTENCDQVLNDDVKKEGFAVGSRSAEGIFYWHTDLGGPQKPPPPV